jgi:glycine cleavage system H lipoate-binding protein/ABC-type phosphate transport system substrate-binding protein
MTMKKTIVLLISFLLIFCSNINGREFISEYNLATDDSIKVLSTPDLYPLSSKWATEYSKQNPEIKIQIISVSDTKMADNLFAEGKIGFVSNEYYSGFSNQLLWRVVVGRDVIVPVINSKNPFADEIFRQGISPETFVRFFENQEPGKWGALLKNNQKSLVNYYWINDESIISCLTGFLNTDKLRAKGIEVGNGEKMISAIQKDPYAIGFCKMINILDLKNQGIAENISLLPIDRNANGIIDYNEKIYDDFNVFSRGVWIGKYPKALFSNIYSVSLNQPKSENEIAFLKWVLTDGQQYLYYNGYSDLLISERQTTVDKLYIARTDTNVASNDNRLPKTILLILASLIAVVFISDIIIRYLRRNRISGQVAGSGSHNVLNENTVTVPKGLYFDKTHTWAFMEQNGVVKVGIDDFLQHVTGTITRIKMKSQGKKVKKGEQIISIIQSGKQLNLYAPVSGTIIEQNKILESNSSLINSSPYTDGWIYKIEPENWHRENQLLFVAEKHKQYIKNEFSRLKDFLSVTLNRDTEKYAGIVLQDGGELKDGILSNMGPEVWEDFQTNFIDPSRQLWFYELV